MIAEKKFPYISLNADIGESCELEGLVFVKDSVQIANKCQILAREGRIVLEDGVKIQDNTLIANSDGHHMRIGKGSIIGKNVTINANVGENCIIEDDVTIAASIGDNCWIKAGSIVETEMGPNSFVEKTTVLELTETLLLKMNDLRNHSTNSS